MKSIKCKNCGLSNFPNDVECRRCGFSFLKAAKATKQKSPRSFSFSTLLIIAVVAGIAYYIYDGTQQSIDKVNANEAKRAASPPAERPMAPGLSRSEYDRQKSQTYGDAVRGSQSLSDHNKHVQQTEKAMQQISNGK
jgi:hypothetical protein